MAGVRWTVIAQAVACGIGITGRAFARSGDAAPFFNIVGAVSHGH